MSNPYNHPYVTAIPQGDGTCEYVEWTQEEIDAFVAEQAEQHFTFEWEEIKTQAEEILADTDWTQNLNNGLTEESKQEFADYRAAVRAIRQGDSVDVTFPTKPQEVWV